MTPPPGRSSSVAVLIAVAIGGVLAVLAGAFLMVTINYLIRETGLGGSQGEFRLIGVVHSLIVGLAAGIPLLMTRPSGPLAPILIVPVAIIADMLGDVIGIAANQTIHGLPSTIGHQWGLYFESYGDTNPVGWGIVLITPLVAVGLAVLRVLMAGRQGPSGPRPARAGQPQPYGQPGQYGPPGQPGQYGPPGQPGPYAQPGQYGQPPAPMPGQPGAPGQYAPPPPAHPGQPPAAQPPPDSPPPAPGPPPN